VKDKDFNRLFKTFETSQMSMRQQPLDKDQYNALLELLRSCIDTTVACRLIHRVDETVTKANEYYTRIY